MSAPRANSGEEQETWRHVHRATPLLRFWMTIVTILAIVALNLTGGAIASMWAFLTGGNWLPLVIGVVALVAVCVAIWLASGIWWRYTRFRVGEEQVELRRGVISRSHRTARYERIQAIDVTEPFLPRLFGLAGVRVETAGGGDSVLEIAFLPQKEAEELRAVLLARVHGTPAEVPATEVSASTDATAALRTPDGRLLDDGVDRMATGDVVVPTVPVKRSLMASVLSPGMIILILGFGIVMAADLNVASVVAFFVAVGPSVWRIIDRSWHYTATFDADSEVLNLAYGLANKRHQAVPLDRVHSVELHQPTLWRLAGWWQVRVNIAGYGVSSANQGSTDILPVGSVENGKAIMELLVGAPQDEGITFESPKRARWLSPLDRRKQSITLHEGLTVTRFGWAHRRIAAINPSHIQELSYVRGPIARLANVATVRLDLVPGPVSMKGRDLDPADAEKIMRILRQRTLPDYTGANYSGPDLTTS